MSLKNSRKKDTHFTFLFWAPLVLTGVDIKSPQNVQPPHTQNVLEKAIRCFVLGSLTRYKLSNYDNPFQIDYNLFPARPPRVSSRVSRSMRSLCHIRHDSRRSCVELKFMWNNKHFFFSGFLISFRERSVKNFSSLYRFKFLSIYPLKMKLTFAEYYIENP